MEGFLEPQTIHHVSAKFKDLPPNEALRLLLGQVNFAVVPASSSKSSPSLYVFRTSKQSATQAIRQGPDEAKGSQ